MVDRVTLYARNITPELASVLEGVQNGDINAIFSIGIEALQPEQYTQSEAEAIIITANETALRAQSGELDIQPTFLETLQIASDYITDHFSYANIELNVDPEDPTRVALSRMSTTEIEEAIGLASQNGGANYDTYRTAFITMNSEYEAIFAGIDAQTSAAGFNPLRDQLTQALNTDPSVAANLILIGRDPERLEALTTLVTDDGDPLTFLRDEAEVESLINSFAEVNGSAPLSPAQEIQPLPDLVEQQIEQIQAGNIDEAPSMQTPMPLVSPGTIDKPPTVHSAPAPTLQPVSFQTAPPEEPESSPTTIQTPFTDTTNIVTANVNNVPDSNITEVTYEEGQMLDHIVREHYNMTDPNMIHRASLIIAAGSDIQNANAPPDGATVKLPPLDMLQEAAGTDDLRLRNLGTHPQEIGLQLQEMMDEASPAVSQGAGYDYLSDARIAAAPQTLG